MAKENARGRSYPAFNLETAIEKANEFYNRYKLGWIAPQVALKEWGYAPKSSNGLRLLAALLHFGLLENRSRGDGRRVRLSEIGKAILLDKRRNSVERNEALKEAALKPVIYNQVWEMLGPDLPTDASIEYELISKMGFNPSTTENFIADFRATMDFIGLTKEEILEEESGDELEEFEADEHGKVDGGWPTEKNAMPEANPRTSDVDFLDIVVPIPSLKDRAILRIPYPMSSDDFRRVVMVIKNNLRDLRDAIVVNNPEAAQLELDSDWSETKLVETDKDEESADNDSEIGG